MAESHGLSVEELSSNQILEATKEFIEMAKDKELFSKAKRLGSIVPHQIYSPDTLVTNSTYSYYRSLVKTILGLKYTGNRLSNTSRD